MRGGSVRGRNLVLYNTPPAGGGGGAYYLGGFPDNRIIRGLGWVASFLYWVMRCF